MKTAAIVLVGVGTVGVLVMFVIMRRKLEELRRLKDGRVMDDRPRYMISVAADIVGMHPQTLRIYESKGLIRPKRTAGNTRLYSEADIERLRLIQQLTNDLGLNLAGVEQVMQLQDEVERMRRTLDRMEREMREAISQVHRQYRRDLVPWKAIDDRTT